MKFRDVLAANLGNPSKPCKQTCFTKPLEALPCIIERGRLCTLCVALSHKFTPKPDVNKDLFIYACLQLFVDVNTYVYTRYAFG
jgi:hypothetical protein